MEKSIRIDYIIPVLSALVLLLGGCEKPSEETPDNHDSQVALIVKCTTGEATEIDLISAELNGFASIENAKETNGTAYFYYSSTDNSVNGIIKNGIRMTVGHISNSGSAFSIVITNLTSETKYYYLAAVAIDDEYYYGDVKSFTTAKKPKELSVTGAAFDITEQTAKLSGYANLTPDLGIVTMGIIYSTEENPTLGNGTELSSKELDGKNMYIVQAKDLTYNTTYYYKAFVQYGGIYRFGEVNTFTTKDITAQVETLEATDVYEGWATMNGKITINTQDHFDVDSVWFLFSREWNTVEDLKSNGVKKTEVTQPTSDGLFESIKKSKCLYPNSTYYYLACGKVGKKCFYGRVKSFHTLDIEESILTMPASDITVASVSLNGMLTKEIKGFNTLQPHFFYSDTINTVKELISNGTKVVSSFSDNYSFCSSLNNLASGKDYYYVAAVLAGSRYYGGNEVKSFTTESIDASVTTGLATNISAFGAQISGNLQVNMDDNYPKKVYFLYGVDPELDKLKENGHIIETNVDSNGDFNCTISSLNSNSVYYYVAVAQVWDTVFYGEIARFNTKNLTTSILPETKWETEVDW